MLLFNNCVKLLSYVKMPVASGSDEFILIVQLDTTTLVVQPMIMPLFLPVKALDSLVAVHSLAASNHRTACKQKHSVYSVLRLSDNAMKKLVDVPRNICAVWDQQAAAKVQSSSLSADPCMTVPS